MTIQQIAMAAAIGLLILFPYMRRAVKALWASRAARQTETVVYKKQQPGDRERHTINHLVEMAEGVPMTKDELDAVTKGAQAMAAALARHRLTMADEQRLIKGFEPHVEAD